MLLSIILPTYNERANIQLIVPELDRVLRREHISAEIIVVDDSSPDGTAAVVRGLAKKYRNVRLILRPKKEGIGAALRQAYNAAKGKYIASLDVDSLSADVIPRMLRKIEEGYDYVNGDRGTFGEWCKGRGFEGKSKEILSIAGNALLRVLFRARLSQFTMNCRIFRRTAWRSIKTKEKGNIFLIEMIVAMRKKGYRITQVPVKFRNRKYGESKMRLGGESIRFFQVLGRLVWNYWVG